MARYAHVVDGVVDNVSEWDGETAWSPGDGVDLHQLPDGSPVAIGWTWDGSVFSDPSQTLDALKAAKRAELDAFNLQISTTPFSWDFTGTSGVGDDGTERADVGVQTFQIAGLQDQSNWTAVGSTSGIAVLAGQGASPAPMKSSDNIWVQATAAQAFAALVTGSGGVKSLLQRQQTYLARYGVLKRAIENAADAGALAAVDITSGWN